MTTDDIIRIAVQCQLVTAGNREGVYMDALTKFADLVAAAEREECADMVLTLTCMGNAKECFETAAAYIRARGNT